MGDGNAFLILLNFLTEDLHLNRDFDIVGSTVKKHTMQCRFLSPTRRLP